MPRVIVVTGLGSLPPAVRWDRLVAPLQRELVSSGLGQVVDYEALRQEAAELGYCPAVEVAIAFGAGLSNQSYLVDLVDQVMAAAGLRRDCSEVPLRWSSYHCQDYFSGGWAERGCFDEPSQTPVIVPLGEAYEEMELQFLVIGHSGCDGIDFGYRSGHAGLWAYYPMDREFRFVAATAAELAAGWSAGKLAV